MHRQGCCLPGLLRPHAADQDTFSVIECPHGPLSEKPVICWTLRALLKGLTTSVRCLLLVFECSIAVQR